MERNVNKILAYTVIAILLGTVTMVVPLALLGPSDPIPESKYNDSELNGGSLERNDLLSSPESPAAASEPSDALPEEPRLSDAAFNETDAISGLYSIGLMIVPSFLIALGTFVYLKKRMI
jgi:hypothetical protein